MNHRYAKKALGGVTAVWVFSAWFSSTAVADSNHYHEILLGDRATGLAGAYCAIADDPSGLFYNPAGIVHASNSNISGSMNAINIAKKTYRNVMGNGKDWVRDSSELLPNFFGLLQDLGGGKAGFSYAVIDSTLENQDEDFSNIQLLGLPVDRFVINFNNQDKAMLFGPSYAIQYRDKLSVGTTLYGYYRSQEQITHLYKEEPSHITVDSTRYLSTDEFGVHPKLGVMYSPAPKWSLGITLGQTFLLRAKIRDQHTGPDETNNLAVARRDDEFTNKRKLPLEIRMGTAYFHSSKFLLSSDLGYFSAADYLKKPVLNFSMGIEYYIKPTWALRTGFYTNNANTASLRASNVYSIQEEHIDYRGFTFSATHFTRSNALTLGMQFAEGNGQAQLFEPTAGDAVLNEVKAMVLNVFMSATYSY